MQRPKHNSRTVGFLKIGWQLSNPAAYCMQSDSTLSCTSSCASLDTQEAASPSRAVNNIYSRERRQHLPHALPESVSDNLVQSRYDTDILQAALPFVWCLPLLVRALNWLRPGSGAAVLIPSTWLRYITFKLTADLQSVS